MSANDKDVAVEKFESLSQDEAQSKHDARNQTMGTVTFTDSDEIFLVPSPSADPRDPLNMSRPAKITFIVLLSIFSSVALCMVSGFGGLLGFYIPVYAEHGATYADITALMTYPSMFMGIGCLFGMPLAMAVGRRPVYLGSMIVLLVGSLLAAYAKDYNWHLGARMVLGLAAGQSEALVPMMIQEIHFLHERSTFLMWQVAIQTLLSAGLTIGASPLAGAIGPKNWYILGGALGIATLVASIFFVPESRYPRTLAAYGQFNVAEGGESEDDSRATVAPPVKLSERPALDFTRYEARTWASDMRIFVGGFDWAEGWYGFVNTFQVLLFPNVFWAFCLNGFTIGVNIAIGTTYGNIVTKAPYNWAQSAASYVTAGQVVIALIALPMLGNGSDRIIKWAAKRNGGVHEPENRILPLVFPLIVGVISAVIYGQAGQFPEKYHWFAIVFAYAGYYFGFIGANIVGITYLLDSYPARSGPILIVITAFRGFVSFGTSYGVAKFIETDGYDGSFGAYAGITALLGLLGIPIFFYGKRIRSFTGRFAMKSKTGVPSMSH